MPANPATASPATSAPSASSDEIEGMYAHLEQALITLDFLDPANPKKLTSRLRRLFSRSGLEHEEVNILRGIAKHILLKRLSDRQVVGAAERSASQWFYFIPPGNVEDEPHAARVPRSRIAAVALSARR